MEAILERPVGSPPIGRVALRARPHEIRARSDESRIPRRPARRELGPAPASSADRSITRPAEHLPSPWRGARCRIHPIGPSPTSSAPALRPRWRLEFEPVRPSLPDRLMGWAGEGDPRDTVRLDFPSVEAALGWAARFGLEVDLVPQRIRTARPRPGAASLRGP
ncbi:MAG: hypothetical protein KatS3mg117_1902 [Geminicoccaceae bacterium]|jgi:hypothetical protein|nr:MAG: hypothetical protein KatS3mg117_1902 [Geminicoccaceae bacterium]